MYVSVLGIELCFKFKHKGTISYFKRTCLYHFICLSLALVTDIILILMGSYGVTDFKTCSITSPINTYIEYAITIISLIIMIGSLIFLTYNRTKHSSKILINFSFVIFFVLFT